LVRANNVLGFNILQELETGQNKESIFISPASIITALAMTYNGAEAETREAMESTLGLDNMNLEEVNEAFAEFMTIINNPDPEVKMAAANSLWAREGVDFKDDFLERNKEYFDAKVASLDFDDPGASDRINNWVKDKTGGGIEDIIEPPINPLTVLFLINAIYFNGDWTEPFDPDMTREIPFHLPGGTKQDYPVMFRVDEFDYLETDLFQAARLPYGKNKRLGMYVFLPHEDIGLEGFLEELNPGTWTDWTASFSLKEGELGLPRFKIEYEASLNDPLKALGMEVAFDENSADFSGMRDIPPRLYISDVKHKSFIEVNEEGTEAAAATSVEIRVESARPDHFTMIADRPFFFAIVDDLTGAILFMGSLLDPDTD